MAPLAYTTRINPTTNGDIHLGHGCMGAINMQVAHQSGGKFILLLDDNQPYWVDRCGKDILTYCLNIRMDLEWLGIVPDEVVYQSAIEASTINELELRFKREGLGPIMPSRYHSEYMPETIDGSFYYPYVPRITLEKVWMDYRLNVNCLIRGWDLITEFSLYEYFCDLLGIRLPRHVNLPRLIVEKSAVTNIDDLSKTRGNWKIRELREKGWSAEYVMDVMKKSYLIDPEKDWTIENVLANPVLREELFRK